MALFGAAVRRRRRAGRRRRGRARARRRGCARLPCGHGFHAAEVRPRVALPRAHVFICPVAARARAARARARSAGVAARARVARAPARDRVAARRTASSRARAERAARDDADDDDAATTTRSRARSTPSSRPHRDARGLAEDAAAPPPTTPRAPPRRCAGQALEARAPRPRAADARRASSSTAERARWRPSSTTARAADPTPGARALRGARGARAALRERQARARASSASARQSRRARCGGRRGHACAVRARVVRRRRGRRGARRQVGALGGAAPTARRPRPSERERARARAARAACRARARAPRLAGCGWLRVVASGGARGGARDRDDRAAAAADRRARVDAPAGGLSGGAAQPRHEGRVGARIVWPGLVAVTPPPLQPRITHAKAARAASAGRASTLARPEQRRDQPLPLASASSTRGRHIAHRRDEPAKGDQGSTRPCSQSAGSKRSCAGRREPENAAREPQRFTTAEDHIIASGGSGERSTKIHLLHISSTCSFQSTCRPSRKAARSARTPCQRWLRAAEAGAGSTRSLVGRLMEGCQHPDRPRPPARGGHRRRRRRHPAVLAQRQARAPRVGARVVGLDRCQDVPSSRCPITHISGCPSSSSTMAERPSRR